MARAHRARTPPPCHILSDNPGSRTLRKLRPPRHSPTGMKRLIVKHRTQVGYAICLFSFCISALVGSLGIAAHMPLQQDRVSLTKLVTALAPAAQPASIGAWTALHVLASDCACSRAVADHLIRRGSLPNLREKVLLVGDDRTLAQRLRSASFAVEMLGAEEASARYNLRGVPWLIFLDPAGKVRYAGGYSGHRDARSSLRDVEIWNTLTSGHRSDPLPVYGCAVGQRLRAQIDPLGIKYGNN